MARRYKSYTTNPLKASIPISLRKLVRIWMKRLGLERNWKLKFYTRQFKDLTAAEAKWSPGYASGSIHFGARWLADEHRTDAETEHTVVHELLHFVFAPMDDSMEDYLGLGKAFFIYAERREQMCDRIATLLIDRYRRNGDVP